MRMKHLAIVALAATILTGIMSSSAISRPASKDAVAVALKCPSTITYSSTATVYFGPYTTEAAAKAAVKDKEQEALDDAEDSAEASCPKKCTSPSTVECYGEADFDDQGATGVVIPGHNNYWVCVVLDINKKYDCKCDN